MSPHFDAQLTAETADLLAQLETLLAQGEPDSERMLSLATALRQTAKLADADTVAAVAERLEDTARSIIDRNVVWSGEIRWLAQQTVADLRLVLRALDRWGESEEQRMRSVLERWDEAEQTEGLPLEQGVPFASDPEYRDRLAWAQSEAAARAGEPIQTISSYFYDDQGPHIVEEPEAERNDDDTGEDALPLLGDLPDFGEARVGLDAAVSLSADGSEPADGADDAVSDPAAAVEEQENLISIDDLLYRGEAALREARALEPRLRAALRDGVESAEELATELFDLLELAADRDPPSE